MEDCDVIILGAGPAGLSAGLFSARYGLKTIILEKDEVGGRANQITKITTYPGILESSGKDLIAKMRAHAEKFGAIIKMQSPKSIEIQGNLKIVHTRKVDYRAKTLIIATGMTPRVLGIPGEKEFTGMGVSYCATCDADFYQDQKVVVVGDNNEAINEGLLICKFASEVDVIVNKPEGSLTCSKANQERAEKEPKMHFIWNTAIESIYGEMNVEGIKIKNLTNNQVADLPCDGVFFFLGMMPATAIVKDLVELDSQGYIHTKEDMSTGDDGIFAIGDTRKRYLSQVLTSASDGAIAAAAAQKYIATH
ncbi:FAD-dependent oxidoreductase [Lactobacillus sp. ESL0791]|uniref:NAD(P)/FAD-dependent oxidoreductase n=1 Tax=Lactobacillus sp. ESL0791 TaxID=2983234 RepID=UPI0023F97B25|nr:FAD-dependent oxidoreductase [Lactobacillus sp. ESL0791]MDF7639669.1 FAD-dependent oxidoreductase [Lactobacillus sp. ESL0791]